MVLYIYLFDSKVLGQMDIVLQWLMYPTCWAFHRLLSSFRSTTKERTQRAEDPCYERYVILTFMIPVLLVILLFTAPVALVAFLCWIPLQRVRHPFRYSCQNTSKEIQLWKERESRERHLRISCINTCLYNEFTSRGLNLGMTPSQRAKQICRLINESQNPPPSELIPSSRRQLSFSIKMQDVEEAILMSPRTTSSVFTPIYASTAIDNRENYDSTDILHSVEAEFFPQIDILCLQGVFNFKAQLRMSQLLHQSFSHIICDVTTNTWRSNRFLTPSGLIVASRYPISDACFNFFPVSESSEAFMCKGALMVKLEIGTSSEGKKLVGFVTNTHLQEGYGYEGVRTRQLSSLDKWRDHFLKSASTEGELTVFDVVCGNLSFDNMSSADKECYTHDFMKSFEDPWSLCPGKDKEWAIGTQFIVSEIHHKDVCTPEGLQDMLSDTEQAASFIESAEVDEGDDLEEVQAHSSVTAHSSVEEQRKSGTAKRRVNYILLAKTDSDSAYETHVTEVNYITKLTGLTAYSPVSCSVIATSAKN